MERPGLLKSVSAIFVFLAAFLAVASYLGGGTAGLVSAGLIAIVAVALYLIFYGWIARFPAVRRRLEPERLPGSVSAPAPPGGERPPPVVSKETGNAPRKSPRPRPEPPKPDVTAMLTRGVRNVCDPGPYDVEPGRPTKIALEAEHEFMLVGTLEEKDGDEFEFMIVDEDNWVRYQQGREYEVQEEGYGEGVFKIKWKVPSGGPWFLVLEAYGKQLVREVMVKLRLTGGS